MFLASAAPAQTFDLNGHDATLPQGPSFDGQAYLNGSDLIVNDGDAAATLTEGGGPAATVYSGAIRDGTATTALVHTGGEVTLTGQSTFSGGTTISGGTVQLGTAETKTTLAGRVDLRPSATLDVVNADLSGVTATVNDGGTVVFSEHAQAAPSTLTNNAGAAGTGGLRFTDTSSAAGATIIYNDQARIDFSGASTLGGPATSGPVATQLTNNGSVTFEDLATAGRARIVNNAAGAVVFSGTSDAGTAQVDNNGTLSFTEGSHAAGASITNNQALNFSGLSQADIAQIMNNGRLSFGDQASASSSSIVNNGDGALSFSGTSTAGAAQVTNSGTATFAASSTAGSAAIVNNEAGTLVFQDTAHAGSSTITNNGTLLFTGAASGDQAAIVANRGSVLDVSGLTDGGTSLGSVDGSGNVLLGSNRLTVGGDGRSTSLLGTIADGGASGGIGGSLVKTGTGTLTLGGQSTYTGPTLVQGGTLAAAASQVLSAASAFTVASQARLDLGGFDQTIGSLAGGGTVQNSGSAAVLTVGGNNLSTVFSGTIQDGGTTSLTKVGTGTFDLTGENTYTGATTVAAGTLLVDGSLASSPITLLSGATLGGTGTVGGLTVGAGSILQPGAATPFSTLTIAGDVTFQPGSTYRITVDPTGRTDLLAVKGSATLNGGTVDVLAGGTFSPSARYTILTAQAGVTGTFGSLNAATDLAFLNPTLTYDANDVVLALGRNQMTFASVADTRNQRAVATALATLDLASPLIQAVLNQDDAGARQAFDATSGEGHASAVTTGLQDALQVQGAVLDRLDEVGRAVAPATAFQALAPLASTSPGLPGLAQGYAGTEPLLPARPVAPSYALWGTGFGDFGRNAGTGNAAALDRSMGGFVAGGDAPIDVSVPGNWHVGLLAGYTNDRFDVAQRGASGSFETVFGGLYGGARYGALDLKLGVTGGGTQTTTATRVLFPGFVDSTRSQYGGLIVQGFGELGFRFAFAGNVLEPTLQAAAIHLDQDGFREAGGASALSGSGRGYDVQTTTLGVRAESAALASLPVFGRMLLGWRHAFGDVDPAAILSFGGGSAAFAVQGAPIDRDALVAEAGFDYRASDRLTFKVGYSGQHGQHASDNAIKGGVDYRF